MRCLSCQYPNCAKCGAKAEKPVTAATARVFLCPDGCRFPPCDTEGCEAQRPRESKYSYDRMPTWHCEACDAKRGGRKLRCSGPCGRKRPRTDFGDLKDFSKQGRKGFRCTECQHPACGACGKRAKLAITAANARAYFCPGKCRHPPCAGTPGKRCKTARPQSSQYGRDVMPVWRCPRCRKAMESD